MSQAEQTPLPPSTGPPYVPQFAQIGGQPTVGVDVPICAVLMFLFLCGAITNFVLFKINRKREHKFVFSLLLFIFCLARIGALTMRIVWAARPASVRVAIVASVLTQAGTLLLFLINLLFTLRLLRAYHPFLGWHRLTLALFTFLLFTLIAVLILVITITVRSFFLTSAALASDTVTRPVQHLAATYFAVLAFLPVPIVLIAMLAPRRTRVEKFGQGRFSAKVALVIGTAALLALGAGFRAGVSWMPPRPMDDPAWYHHKAAFYCFYFVIELVIVFTYTIARFDRRFHVPDGSSGPGHYAGDLVRKSGGGMQRNSIRHSLIPTREPEKTPTGISQTEELKPSSKHEQRSWEARAREELEHAERGDPIAP